MKRVSFMRAMVAIVVLIIAAALLAGCPKNKSLIESGANAQVESKEGNASLPMAVEEGEAEITEPLIEDGASVNVAYKREQTSQHVVAERDHNDSEIAGPLKYSTIHEAAAKGDLDDVRRHLQRGAAVNAEDWGGRTPLHYAATEGHIKVADFLIKNGANVNETARSNTPAGGCYTPLQAAAGEGHTEMVRMLIRKGANEYVEYAIGWAFRNNHADIALQIAESADVDTKDEHGNTLLHQVASIGQVQIVDLLIKRHADVNAKNEWGQTPLHEAAANGHAKIVELLVNGGADANAKSARGLTPTPLWEAYNGVHSRCHTEVVKVLVENGADVKMKDKDGDTLLHIAAWRDDAEVAELLVANGADVNARDGTGGTPLHLAAKEHNCGVAELLIENGAEVNARSKNGKTPLGLTGWYPREELRVPAPGVFAVEPPRESSTVDLLRKHGAKG